MRTLTAFVLAAVPLLPQIAKDANEQGVAMGRIHIVTSDAEAQKRFWAGVLGAKVKKAGALEVLLLPDVIVTLEKGQPKGGTEESAVNHLGFKVKDLASTKSQLTAVGGKVVREMPETKQMFILFPDDVKVEFTEDSALTIPVTHHHVHFFTHDLEAQRAWYVKTFGAKPGMRGKFQAADLPGVNLTFSPSEKPTAATKGRAVSQIGFEVRDLAGFRQKVEGLGMKPQETGGPKGVRSLLLQDPFGVEVEVTQGLRSF